MAEFEFCVTHFDMLHDAERNKKYKEGIYAAVEHLKRTNSAPITVLDIGCGSGLLSMFALQAGCSHAYAIECNPTIAEIAVENFEKNNLSESVTLLMHHSTSLSVPKDIPVRPQLMVGELLDTWLIAEGALPTMRHAREALLDRNAICVPDSGDVKVQLLSGEYLTNRSKVPGLQPCPYQTAEPLHTAPLLQAKLVEPVTDVHRLFLIDFATPSPNQRVTLTVPITKSGTVSGLHLFWDLHLFGEITLSTAPQSPPREHWRQGVVVFAQNFFVEVGDYVQLTAFHDDNGLVFEQPVKAQTTERRNVLSTCDGIPVAPLCSCNVHNGTSPNRLSYLNNSTAVRKVQQVARGFRRSKASIILGDGPVLPECDEHDSIHILTGSLASERAIFSWFPQTQRLTTTCIETNATVQREQSTEVAGTPYEDLPLLEDGSDDLDTACHRVAEHFNSHPVESLDVLTEPHFDDLDHEWPLLTVLYVLKLLKKLRKAMEPTGIPLNVMPIRAVVVGRMFECHELWQEYQPVGKVEGVVMSAINALHYDDPTYVHTVDVFPYLQPHSTAGRFISGPIELLSIDLTDNVSAELSQEHTITTQEGKCHAFVLHVDFDFGNGVRTSTQCYQPGQSEGAASTYYQGVRFFPTPFACGPGTDAEQVLIHAKLDLKRGRLQVQQDWLF
eukprot:TRINITY_DN13790_c0_g1_i1.p1 TRINITY_DN13790_c0_g1~~TRINITY_DN13790_c0_g1_i1.p1  ORF type:complete len:681 (-),score=96.53 TRINITY_DN13790_c0_g1_i1:6-2018(-)